MKLVAEILTGSLFSVEVEEDATVGDLKKKIGQQENLPVHRLILLLDDQQGQCGLPMDQDDVSVKSYGAHDGSHVYIFFEPLNKATGAWLDSPPTPEFPDPDLPSPSRDNEDK